MNMADIKRRIFDDKGQIIGTWEFFDRMDNTTLAYNLGDLSEDEREKVPEEHLNRWEVWRQEQSDNSYWLNPLHC